MSKIIEMNNQISIEVTHNSSVHIGCATELLAQLLPQNRRIIIITDTNVATLLKDIVMPLEHIIIDSGESSKSLDSVAHICSQLLEMGADRSTFLLAVGGGVVSDITGFVASIYMRGVRFGFISTTLLSQVDAGVGGKNGVNLNGYKNIIGCFNQPQFVICDVNHLKTLCNREFRSGLAELIKAAIIADYEMFSILEQHTFEELRSNSALLQKLLIRAIQIKAEIVARDEHEEGERRLLNLGHTYGHAIEKLSSDMNHGEAVAVGIIIAAHKSLKFKTLSSTKNDYFRIFSLFERLGFTLTPPVQREELDKVIYSDKKCDGSSIHFFFVKQIGECVAQKISLNSLCTLNM